MDINDNEGILYDCVLGNKILQFKKRPFLTMFQKYTAKGDED